MRKFTNITVNMCDKANNQLNSAEFNTNKAKYGTMF